jgi:hypothetical protein
MKLLIAKLKQRFKSMELNNIRLYIIAGTIGTFLVKDIITPFLFAGRGFSGRSLYIRISLFTIYFVIIVFFLFIIQKIFKQIIFRNKPIAGKNHFNPLVAALITLSLGILTIFIINNLIARIDTENWKLKGLDIIPVIEPIGNDFRVGLYWPAENLLKSGFKSIGPINTYPSVYPPLVSVLSLPYLLFNAQTAYLINTILIFVLNFMSLFFATLIINEILLKEVINDQLTRNMLSLLIFIVIAFYNFSGYSFLFSMERGNVDVIAMFFMILSIWVLITQPKNIWLQVIFLSIATHYKIYPAVLFLVLLYCHGKKLILPMLAVNLVFLFVLGPKVVWAFITSLTSGGSGAGLGNQWSWIGNHGAYSLAQDLTNLVPSFTNHFNELFILSMLVPFLIWLLGTINILKNKYSPINAIYLLMISIPLMDLLPTISNDYKLIIESTAFLIFVGVIIFQILQNQKDKQLSLLVLVLIIMFFIARPYDMNFQYISGTKYLLSYLINNKYIWILTLEGAMVWNLFKHQEKTPVLSN